MSVRYGHTNLLRSTKLSNPQFCQLFFVYPRTVPYSFGERVYKYVMYANKTIIKSKLRKNHTLLSMFLIVFNTNLVMNEFPIP